MNITEAKTGPASLSRRGFIGAGAALLAAGSALAAEDRLDAVYIATDAPSHVRLAILALEHGLHVASAVPAFFGKNQLEFVPKLADAVKRSGKLYMMNETTAFRAEAFAMRRIFEAGFLGEVTYTEGEYFHGCGPDLKAVMCGSHGYLTDDFIRGILLGDHAVCVDVKTALDTTIAGVYAHLSAMKGGETLKIPTI